MIAAAIRNPLITLALALALVLGGLWAWRHIPLDAIPDLSDNQVIVWAEWPGKSAEDVDLQITSRLARELQGLPGVATVRGMSLYGASYVYVIFDERRDLYECRTRTLERLSQVQALMPAGVQARLGPDATAMGQVFAFTLQGQRDTEAKRYVLDQVVVPALKGVSGVSEVAPVGGVVREYQIDVDPTRLEEQAITIDMLMMAVKNSGRDVGAMSVEHSGVETMIRGLGFIRELKDVENIVVRGNTVRSAGLLLKDVAHVHLGGAVRQGILADAEGEQVGAIVGMRVREDPKAVIAAVKQRLAGLAPALAQEGLTVTTFYDRSRLIEETNATLARTLIEELIVTILVIVVFLLHARASVVVAISLPLGVLTTFLAMHLLGVSANIMSLAGIAIAIGVMVDFGIVMTENITQHLCALKARRDAECSNARMLECSNEQPAAPVDQGDTAKQGEVLEHSSIRAFEHSSIQGHSSISNQWHFNDPDVIQAVITGAQEVSRALLTAAATTIIGFLPIFVLTDQAGRLFIPLAMTKTLAIGGAVLFGMLLVPLLCRLLLPPWQMRKGILISLSGLAGGLAFGWFVTHGLTLGFDHDRWSIIIPGFVVGPLVGGLAAYVVWRLGCERLVSYEDNPVSHAIHVAYDWAFTRIQRHRYVFTLTIATVALTGWLLGVGWQTLSWPLRQSVALAGGDMSALSADVALKRWFPGIGASFLPPLDEGSLLFMPSIPASGGLGETLRVLKTQNQLIETVPEVAQVMGKMGRAETALDPAPIGMIETVVQLKPYAAWPLHEFTADDGTVSQRPRTLVEVRAALAAISDIPGVAPSWLQPIETRVVMLSTGIKSKIALQVLGDDGEALERFAERAEKIVQQVPGAVDVQMQREGGKPYGEIRLDPARMARFGITAEGVMATVETALGGMPLVFSVEGTQRYGVRIRYSRERRDNFDEMSLLQVPIGSGQHGAIALQSLVAVPVVHTVALEAISAADWLAGQTLSIQRNTTILAADRIEVTLPAGDELVIGAGMRLLSRAPSSTALTSTIGPMAIRSEGGKRTQYVLLNARDRAEVDVVRDADQRVRAAIADGRLTLPKGATFRWVGSYEQKLKADATMTWVIAASLAVMLVLIYLGTRSALTTAIIISCNLTVTTAGGFIAVWLAGVEMTTAVIVGFLVLMGVMFNDGILLGTYLYDQFKIPPRDVEDMHRRVFIAGLRRRRPALMTNLTTLLALVPILWSDGRGAEVMRPMVLPVIGGMIADLISLFSVPVFFAWWWERKLRP